MAQQEPIRVQIEGLDDLRALIREMRIAAQEMRDAGREWSKGGRIIRDERSKR